MRKTFLLALGALMSISAWSFDNVPATFSWTVGNESAATVTSDAADGVKETKVGVGVGLTVAGPKSDYAANNGKAMMQYKPAESNKGVDASVMIEYTVKMKKGLSFTMTGISYDALKDGTDNASYHWSYAVDGVESEVTAVSKDELVRNNNTTGTPALNHSHAVTAAAGQVVAFRIYVSGFGNTKNFALSNIQLTGTVNGEEEVRAFTNFKVELRTNPYSVIEPASLPEGVTITCPYHDGQHGAYNGDITVPVDGPVKFTIGACQHSGSEITVQKDGVDFATINNNTGTCGETEGQFINMVTWTYNKEEAATLVFHVPGNTYVPFFFAEACEYVPQVEVRYYDVDGKTLIGEPQIVDGGSALAFAYGASDVTVAEGKAFRGWFNSAALTATKVAEGISLTEDLKLYAKATDIEVAESGKIYDYDLTKNYFYPEDHELFQASHGKFHDAVHGWYFDANGMINVYSPGTSVVVVTLCTYSESGKVQITSNNTGHVLASKDVVKNETPDGTELVAQYSEGPGWVNISWDAKQYIHKVVVYDVEYIVEPDETTGYYIVPAGDGASLILTLVQASEGAKIFLPNGEYDLGETALTTISKNNISIIGQSMEKTIIKNAPDFHNEGIGTTATFLVTANNTYFQDLTIQNGLDYFGAIAAGLSGARAVVLQDKGSKTICKNVKMLSNQDTYYSNKIGAVKYFEDCEIHGTVDFICGDGSVYFYGTELVCEQRNKNGGGADAVTASNADANDKGYVFDYSTIRYAENIEGTKPVVSLGRSWNNSPKCIFLNTFLDDSNGELNMYKDANAQKDKIARWTLGAMNALPAKFGEFHSVNSNGEDITPAKNEVTFVLGSEEKPMNTILTADEAATYTMEYTLGDWAATAKSDATQAIVDLNNIDPNGIYLIENPQGHYEVVIGSWIGTDWSLWGEEDTLRKANARGGFGPAVCPRNPAQGVENAACSKDGIQKIMRDGQIIIIRDGKEYNALGVEL